MSTELTVSIKGDDSSYKQQFLLYEDFTWNENDVVIRKCIADALSNAQIMPETIRVRALLVIK